MKAMYYRMSVVAVLWGVIVEIVLIVECDVVVIMKENGWEIVEDMVDMVVFVELWVGGHVCMLGCV